MGHATPRLILSLIELLEDQIKIYFDILCLCHIASHQLNKHFVYLIWSMIHVTLTQNKTVMRMN